MWKDKTWWDWSCGSLNMNVFPCQKFRWTHKERILVNSPSSLTFSSEDLASSSLFMWWQFKAKNESSRHLKPPQLQLKWYKDGDENQFSNIKSSKWMPVKGVIKNKNTFFVRIVNIAMESFLMISNDIMG